jgi:hypothetical protein
MHELQHLATIFRYLEFYKQGSVHATVFEEIHKVDVGIRILHAMLDKERPPMDSEIKF